LYLPHIEESEPWTSQSFGFENYHDDSLSKEDMSGSKDDANDSPKRILPPKEN
jgi:hypothetical protein